MNQPKTSEDWKDLTEVVSEIPIGEQKQLIPFQFWFVQPEIDRHFAMTFQGEIHLNELSRRRNAGDRNIHFLDGSTLYGPDPSECTVDGGHATDLGMYFIAITMAPVIERILTWK